ncbi:MAG: SAM-dependent methyltransferase [Leptospiraceae bacterium]|nr:SAM-dependent methyltransferase [Leptospiraceae bacterium]
MTGEHSKNQTQTRDTFGFKWAKRDTYESPAVLAEWKRWLLEKYLDNEPANLEKILIRKPSRILDAGCGSAVSGTLFFGDSLNDHEYVGVDISDAVNVARDRFTEMGLPGTFVQSDLKTIPEELGKFDVIFSEGVLHHTDSVKDAIAALAPRLTPEGYFLFYVYSKKAPIREFTDDYVREAISDMSDDEAWEALKPLTRLGKVLGDLDVEFEVPDDIPILGIEKGTYNLQRFFFYKICKAFYRPEYSEDEMNHINFDWFRPHNCYRHTPEEIGDFCAAAGLQVERMHVGESGIAVIARPGR